MCGKSPIGVDRKHPSAFFIYHVISVESIANPEISRMKKRKIYLCWELRTY